MADLIDRDELMRKHTTSLDHANRHNMVEELKCLFDLIDNAPTIDAVPVVRCKDCKYSGDYYHDGSIYCRKPHKMMEWHENNPNYYCADGERKVGDRDERGHDLL